MTLTERATMEYRLNIANSSWHALNLYSAGPDMSATGSSKYQLATTAILAMLPNLIFNTAYGHWGWKRDDVLKKSVFTYSPSYALAWHADSPL